MRLMSIGWILLITGLALGQLVNPESIVYDSEGNRYFVSNNGNGTISEIDSVGNISTWATGLSAPAGITLVNGVVYCNSTSACRGFDLETGAPAVTYPVTGAGYLNDITSDGTYLYLTDGQRGRITQIEIATGDATTLVSSDLTQVNGIYFDEANQRLLICEMPQNARIREVQLPGGEVNLLYTTTLSVLDGIVMDGNGYVYVSSNYVPGFGGDDHIYKFDPLFAEPPVAVSSGHQGCADIYYNLEQDILAVPNFMGNYVEFLDMSNSSGENPAHAVQFTLGRAYPNPFNSATTIPLALDRDMHLSISVYDMIGRRVATLADGWFSRGQHRFSFDGASFGSGTYFISVTGPDGIHAVRTAILIH